MLLQFREGCGAGSVDVRGGEVVVDAPFASPGEMVQVPNHPSVTLRLSLQFMWQLREQLSRDGLDINILCCKHAHEDSNNSARMRELDIPQFTELDQLSHATCFDTGYIFILSHHPDDSFVEEFF